MESATDLKQSLLFSASDQPVDAKLIAEFDLECARAAVQRRQRAKRWWRILTATLICSYLAWQGAKYVIGPYRSINPALLDPKVLDEFDYSIGREFFIADENDDHPHDCARIQLGPKFSEEPIPLLYNISTKPEKIGVVSRGPIAGDVRLVAGGTTGDDVEVEITFRKTHHYGPNSRTEDPHPHPHPHPPPPPALAICQFMSETGEVKGIGLFAHPPRRHPHGPPPPPPPVPFPYKSSMEKDTTVGHPFRFFGSTSEGTSSRDHHQFEDRMEGPMDCPHRRPPWRRDPQHYPPILADIVIRFPKKASINTFDSSLQFFTTEVEDLDSAVSFKGFNMVTVGHSITVQGLSTNSAKVVSMRGGIAANISVRDSLEVVSVDKPLLLNATLFSDPKEEVVNPTRLSIVGSKASISANVSLSSLSSKTSTYTPSYEVKMANHHASSHIRFLTQPLKSSLFLRADTNLGELVAAMAPEYEGSFELVAIGKVPLVNVTEGVEDPYGEGRKRSVEVKKNWWCLSGTVSWLKPEAAYAELLGHVKLVGTWAAPITLVL